MVTPSLRSSRRFRAQVGTGRRFPHLGVFSTSLSPSIFNNLLSPFLSTEVHNTVVGLFASSLVSLPQSSSFIYPEDTFSPCHSLSPSLTIPLFLSLFLAISLSLCLSLSFSLSSSLYLSTNFLCLARLLYRTVKSTPA